LDFLNLTAKNNEIYLTLLGASILFYYTITRMLIFTFFFLFTEKSNQKNVI